MREIFFFALASIVAGTVFLVSLFELIFTIRRRKANEELQGKIRELKAVYNTSMNRLVLEDDKKIVESEEQIAQSAAAIEEQKKAAEAEFTTKLEEAAAKSEKALDAAKAKAKKLQEEARMQAQEYLAARQKEVEEDLMNLVISVTKKVLPQGLTYDVQKDLVLHALEDIKVDNDHEA